ncbi:Chromodomain-helicase-DNA-binding protein 1-like [Phytophthora cactorum]|uniref:Chromodomain-helicase-DNA-binding protein 1-like n=1 Tax=Phytophthora cactorum TaxID=29920 RepID=A0A329SHU9_9STRA|nr:Chromodomain-helicase-DNA-binding protein 1-like [Phytophthora cactorum]KAG3225090.1 Chromodomain-helicase-DNA-binding protein 1-like [Phytophthora cactorum]RAW36141.1 Chromodomain-helicase-DNA-binding protein 1-like [Phytophthora cactorum]
MEKVVQKLELRGQQPTPLADRITTQPSLLENVTLHDYQMTGLQWLLRKHEQRLNPILGDEMGLGKTLQVISFIAALVTSDREKKIAEGGRYLVVAPLSVLPNWMEQFEQFAPSISTVMYIGPAKDREATQKVIVASPLDQPLVVVTSYEMLLFDHEFFHKTVWEVMIMDEGHRLKNPKGQLHGIVSTRLRSKYMAILTGTPIQNDLQELFALLSILNRSICNDQKLFETTFRDYFSAKAQRLDENRQAKSKRVSKAEELMRRLLAPLLLLRTVEDVRGAFTLPPLSEMVVHTPMSAMQRVYYKEIITRNAEVLNRAAKAQGNRVPLINILPQLRKACNHPYLFPGAEPEPFVEGSHLYENSGKLFVLHQILPRLKQKGHRVLLFSQSPPFLDIIQDFLTLESFAYERIDGSVRGKERWQCIERFKKDPETFVFLISTRAGGLGLNLQSADTVIFADSDYNPQTDLQAIARAYRLGQTKPIHVIKFLCANTVEESIYRRTLKKMRMADRIRNLARRTDDEDDETDDDSNKSLLDTIQFGLHRLMQEAAGEDEDTLMKPLEEEYIQHILARKSLHPVEEIVCSDNVPVATLKSDKLLESGGNFQEENMYYFEGEDYTKTVNIKEQDAALLEKLCKEAATSTKRQTKTARKRYEQDDEEEDEEDEEQAIENEAERARIREERRQKALERKLAQWKANKYTSAAIDISKPGDGSVPSSPRRSDDYDSSRNSGRLYYKSGDASHPPLSSLRSGPYIVFHCVDNSGVWCSRGFFRSLSALSPAIQKQYEAAARNGDLKLGSAHLIRLPTNGYVCLLVVQGFIGKKKQRVGNGPGTVQIVRQGKSSTFRLNALETALQALAHRALELGATVHLPRIGYGTPNFNWYAVERLLARNLRDVGVEATIYYYSRRS